MIPFPPKEHTDEKTHRRLLADAINWVLQWFTGAGTATNNQYMGSDGNGGIEFRQVDYSDLANSPTSLGELSPTESAKLAGIEENATATEIANMVLNGRANRGSNLNWSTAEYRAAEGVNNGPCFYKNAPSPTLCRSDEFIPVSETEHYLLAASARVSASGMQVYLGVQCFDANEQAIDYWECWRDTAKNTTLFEAVTQGALTVKIVPASEDWFGVGSPFSYIQWDIAADFSDLPQQSATRITNIDKTTAGSGYWTLTLDTPAPASYPLGTPVGNSRSGGTATYALNATVINTTDWVHFENTLTPCADKTRGPLSTEIRAGTRYVRFIWWPGYVVGGEAWLDSVAMVPVSSWEAQPWTAGTSLADAINNVYGIENNATVGATWDSNISSQPSNTNIYNGDAVSGLSTLLPNWNLSIVDSVGNPAGLYPVSVISDFSGISSGVDGDDTYVRLSHASDATIGYGFPAIDIDDTAAYKVSIRHRASSIGSNGLTLAMEERNDLLSGVKTHIGDASGVGPKTIERTSRKILAIATTFPGTTWQVNEYTYTPTIGTKAATFAMLNFEATTVNYDIERVMITRLPGEAQKNTNVTINADGTLTGAGGGQIDALSLLNGPAQAGATQNILYRSETIPASAQTGDLWLNTLTGLVQKYESGVWVDFATKNAIDSGFNIVTAVYFSQFFDVGAYDSIPRGLAFSNDGLKMFFLGAGLGKVHEFDLTTPYYIRTATFSAEYDASAQLTVGEVLRFAPTGDKFYIMDGADIIYQYDLTTAWDITTAVYASKSFDISAQSTNMRGMEISADGGKIYVISPASSPTPWVIYEYDLTTAYDISTAQYNGNNFSDVWTQPWHIEFSPNGENLVVSSLGSISLYQYKLSTAWDITTAYYTGNNISLAELPVGARLFAYEQNGFKMYAGRGLATDTKIYQYSLDIH